MSHFPNLHATSPVHRSIHQGFWGTYWDWWRGLEEGHVFRYFYKITHLQMGGLDGCQDTSECILCSVDAVRVRACVCVVLVRFYACVCVCLCVCVCGALWACKSCNLLKSPQCETQPKRSLPSSSALAHEVEWALDLSRSGQVEYPGITPRHRVSKPPGCGWGMFWLRSKRRKMCARAHNSVFAENSLAPCEEGGSVQPATELR